MNKIQRGLLPALLLGSVSLLLQDAVLLAQASSGLDEVVVTARKREESLMEVPLAITAFTAEKLKSMAMEDLQDIQLYTPSFSFTNMQGGSARNDRSSNSLVFRGLNLSANTGITAGGQVFIDGAPVVGGHMPSIVDAERVEVLKGPQSAYFGRSTFSGAINFVMKEPGSEFGGTAGLDYSPTFGSNEQYLSIEGPITENLGIRVSGRHWAQGGYVQNWANPSVDLGERDTKSVSTNIAWTPTDAVKVKFFYNYFKDEDGPGAQFAVKANDPEISERAYPDGTCDSLSDPIRAGFEGQDGERWTYGTICGELPSVSNLDPSYFSADAVIDPILKETLFNPDPAWTVFDPNYHREAGLKREAHQAHLRIDWEFGDGYQFTSLTAAHTNKIQNILDLNYRDGRERANPGLFVCQVILGHGDQCREDWNTTLLNQGEQDDWSQELRVTSPQDRRLRWTAGFNYFDAYSPGGTVYGNLFIGPFFTATIAEQDVSTPSVFGAIYYDFGESWTLGVEARWQQDTIKQHVIYGASGPPPADAEFFEAEFESFSPRVTLNYNYADNSTLYGLFSRGYRPGRFNTSLATEPQETLDILLQVCPECKLEVDEEQLDNYEFGVKSTWLDGRARTTIAIYYDEWIDGQVSNSIPVFVDGTANLISVTLNNGTAKLKGVEFEGEWAATDNFMLSGSLGYNHTEIESYVCGDCNLNYGSFDGVEGNRLPGVPEITYSISGQYTNNIKIMSMSDGWEWYGRFDWAHQGSRMVDYSNVAETAAYDNLNLRLGIVKEDITIEAYVLNATDHDEFIGAGLGVDLFTFGAGPSQMNEFRIGAPIPRAWGVRATYRF